MKNTKLILPTLLLAGTFLVQSCKKDDVEPTTPTTGASTKTLTMNFSGLEDLGANYKYEGWIIVNGLAKTAGIFTVDASGVPSQTSFTLDATDLDNATAYVLTIEPAIDPDPNPSAVHIIGGDFSGTSAGLSVSHPAAIGTDFLSSTGGYILATPTDGGMTTDENSGVWFLDPAGPSAGLTLPALPSGWKYEGWAVVNGTPVSTGTFTSATGSDELAPYSGATAGPGFPGEDFLMNAPAGLNFPLDLAGETIVVSVEPFPDNSPAPFALKPLVGMVPSAAVDHTLYNMTNNASNTNPTGTVTRN